MTDMQRTRDPIYSTLGGDEDLSEIVQMFVDEMPHRLTTLLDQLNASQWDALRCSAHQLKGAGGSYGFDPISSCAATLEKNIRSNESEEQIRRAVADLVDMCRRARAGVPG